MKTIYLKVSIAEDYDDICDELVLADFLTQPNESEWSIELLSAPQEKEE